MADDADRLDCFETEFLRDYGVGCGILEHSDHQEITAFRGKIEQPEVARMHDVEIPGDEDDFPGISGFPRDRGDRLDR
jgi:hypothetical protein